MLDPPARVHKNVLDFRSVLLVAGVLAPFHRRLVTIGRYGVITLANAREEAKRILAEHTLGRVRPHSITYATAVELFLTDKARGRRQSTVYSYKIKLDRLNFKGQLSDITHAEASRHLDRIKAPSERSHVLSAARAFFNWCAKRRYVTDNPFFGLTKSAHKGASNSFSR